MKHGETAHNWQQVARYDWRAVAVPELDEWAPTQGMSVVIPAFENQDQLDLTLASLAKQRFPRELLEVVVVDDGSRQPLVLPDLAPPETRIVRLDRKEEWGRARACDAGARAAKGEILLFLDADMVVHADHLLTHARWHHVVQDAVTLGHKLFVDFSGITAPEVYRAAGEDGLEDLVADRPQQEHEWVETLIERTDQLTTYGSKMFMAAVGANVGMRAALYSEVGGFRTHLRSGEDMELAYRLMVAGAVFVPERGARCWHQGPATFMTRAAEVRRLNQPNFSNYIAVPGAFRPWTPGRQYAVPMVKAFVKAGDTFEETQGAVDTLLGSEEPDLAVAVYGVEGQEAATMLDAQYRADPRVEIIADKPMSGFPSRFTMFVPAHLGLKPAALTTMLRRLERARVGLLQVRPTVSADSDANVMLWRTAALHRAARATTPLEDLIPTAGRLFGYLAVDAAEVGVVDLRTDPLPERPLRRPSTRSLSQRLADAETELKELRERNRTLRASNRQQSRRTDASSAGTGGYTGSGARHAAKPQLLRFMRNLLLR